jgi:phosphocarrier protein HPr
MKTFDYTIKDSCGIHARPAGLLVKLAKSFAGTVTLTRGDKQCDMKKLMALMSMGVKQGETVQVALDGEGEEAAAAALEKFFAENL